MDNLEVAARGRSPDPHRLPEDSDRFTMRRLGLEQLISVSDN